MAAINCTYGTQLSTATFESRHGKGTCTRYPVFELTFGKGEGIFWVLMSVLTLAANAVSIFTLIKSKRRNTNHSIFLVSLLASNMVHSVAVTPVVAYASFNDGIPCLASDTTKAISSQTMLISLMSVAAIAVDRLRSLKVMAPSSNANQMVFIDRRVNNRAVLAVAAIWITSSLVGIFTSMEVVEGKLVLYLKVVLLVTAVTLLLMVYVRIRRVFKGVPGLQNSSTSARKAKASLKLMMSIICCLLLMWLPDTVIKILQSRGVIAASRMNSAARKLVFLDPLLDPINYVIIRYNRELVRIFGCCRRARRDQP